jgi:UDP-N-acetylmuramate dehydrogenase
MGLQTMTKLINAQWDQLVEVFGESLQRDVPLARFTAAQIGGLADCLVAAESVDHLANIVSNLWGLRIPFVILGGGSNVLVSDAGVREVVILNRARETAIDEAALYVWSGSGASFGQLARRVSARGFGGMEWATGIPGTVGGAVYGNAGAHGGDVAGNLQMAEILHQDIARSHWTVEQMGFSYRSSTLKRESHHAVILSARFRFNQSTPEAVKSRVEEFGNRRKITQPPGASMGSMFKNPPGDYAGRLIELAGLKGTRIGGAEISSVHANFFISDAGTKARDIRALIQLAQKAVLDRFGVDLELEIELIGDWESNNGEW